jgi:DNA-3-methyladenine glycosylase II
MTPSQITQAEDALIQLDPALGKLIAFQRPLEPRVRRGYFESLCRTIIGQQVSVAAASTIYGRFEQITGLAPERVLALTEAEVKTIGLSRQKASYMHDLAGHFVDRPDVYDHLDQASDEDAIAELTAVKGIGPWSAQMFLIFTLGRPDVFAPDDVGLQQAMKRLYDWAELPPKSELVAAAERWAPYRSVACLHLWRSLDNEPT